MRTNIAIDDKLMAEALRASGAKTKREAVKLPLKVMVDLRKQVQARQLRGKIAWEGRLDDTDSSVWINYFRGAETPQVGLLDGMFGRTRLAVGNLIVAEILQGVRDEREFNLVRKTFHAFKSKRSRHHCGQGGKEHQNGTRRIDLLRSELHSRRRRRLAARLIV